MRLLDRAGQTLAAALDVLSRRHALLAANVANVQTPGYLRADLDFTSALRAALARGERGGAEGIGPPSPPGASGMGVFTDPFIVLDEGGADLEVEMAEVARNSLRMMAVATLLSMRMELLRSAISEGRR